MVEAVFWHAKEKKLRVELLLLGLLFVMTVVVHLEGLRQKVIERMETLGVYCFNWC